MAERHVREIHFVHIDTFCLPGRFDFCNLRYVRLVSLVFGVIHQANNIREQHFCR